MAFYESVSIIRQDLSSAEVDKISNDFKEIVKNFGGSVLKTEYWGLRSLAYEINGNKKGHYYFMVIEGNNKLLAEIRRRTKLSDSIIRSSLVRILEVSKKPSAILKAKSTDTEDTVDVTAPQNQHNKQ